MVEPSASTPTRAFLVGCPRSGTTLLQGLLSAHPQIHSLPETHFFQRLYRSEDHRRLSPEVDPRAWTPWRRLQRARRRLVDGLGLGLSPVLSRCWSAVPELAAHRPAGTRRRQHAHAFLAALDSRCAQAPGKVWLEKTPDHLYYLRQIGQATPQARVLHLVRDGEEVVASLYHAAQQYPQWAPYRDIARAVDRWNRAWLETQAWCTRPGHLLVRYEALIAAPDHALAHVLAFLGCEHDAGLRQRQPAAARGLIRGDEPWKAAALGALTDRRKFQHTFDAAQRQQIREGLLRPDWEHLRRQPQVVA